MNRNEDPRDAHLLQQHVIDRRMLITHGLGAATVGALLGSTASVAAATGAGAGQAPGRMPGIALPQGMRRVVTGNDAEGQSYIVADDRVTIGPVFPNIFKTTGDDPFGPGPEPEPRTLYPTDMARIETGGGRRQLPIRGVASNDGGCAPRMAPNRDGRHRRPAGGRADSHARQGGDDTASRRRRHPAQYQSRLEEHERRPGLLGGRAGTDPPARVRHESRATSGSGPRG